MGRIPRWDSRRNELEVIVTSMTGARHTLGVRCVLKGILAACLLVAARGCLFRPGTSYPYWETDAAEWETYTRLWLGHGPRELPDLPSPYPVIE